MEFAFPREFSGQEFLPQKSHYWPEGDISRKECYTSSLCSKQMLYAIQNAIMWMIVAQQKVSIRLIGQFRLQNHMDTSSRSLDGIKS